MKIKPKDGVKARDPQTLRIVPPEGITVDKNDLYWHRALQDGDFEIVHEGDDA